MLKTAEQRLKRTRATAAWNRAKNMENAARKAEEAVRKARVCASYHVRQAAKALTEANAPWINEESPK